MAPAFSLFTTTSLFMSCLGIGLTLYRDVYNEKKLNLDQTLLSTHTKRYDVISHLVAWLISTRPYLFIMFV